MTGPYDAIVRVSADDIDTLGRMIVSQVQTVEVVVTLPRSSSLTLPRCESTGDRSLFELSLPDVGEEQAHGESPTWRWILLHMIEEYARHNGHADLIRQAIDPVGE